MIREITIKPVLNGFVCQVGCQQVVFSDIDTMCSRIRDYYRNPAETEKYFLGNALNKTMDNGPLACAPEPCRPPDSGGVLCAQNPR